MGICVLPVGISVKQSHVLLGSIAKRKGKWSATINIIVKCEVLVLKVLLYASIDAESITICEYWSWDIVFEVLILTV